MIIGIYKIKGDKMRLLYRIGQIILESGARIMKFSALRMSKIH
jgi:hypothetical protein